MLLRTTLDSTTYDFSSTSGCSSRQLMLQKDLEDERSSGQQPPLKLVKQTQPWKSVSDTPPLQRLRRYQANTNSKSLPLLVRSSATRGRRRIKSIYLAITHKSCDSRKSIRSEPLNLHLSSRETRTRRYLPCLAGGVELRGQESSNANRNKATNIS